jgi:hypothetical protein
VGQKAVRRQKVAIMRRAHTHPNASRVTKSTIDARHGILHTVEEEVNKNRGRSSDWCADRAAIEKARPSSRANEICVGAINLGWTGGDVLRPERRMVNKLYKDLIAAQRGIWGRSYGWLRVRQEWHVQPD